MLSISIQTHGKPLHTLRADLKKYWFELQSEVIEVGKEIHTFMCAFIQANKKRPRGISTSELENSITFDYYTHGYTAGFSIGDIAVLNQKTPYWRAVNYGSAHIIGQKVPIGGFVPGTLKPDVSAFRQGRWSIGEANYYFTAKKPIPPMNYIQQSHHLLRLRLASAIRKAKTGKL